jgi:N-acetylglutamate synthase-like GNAT family acetyltransferase
MYIINDCSDYEKLSSFFYENGLEIEPGTKRPDSIINCWKCIDKKTNKLIGGASLEERKGLYVVSDVAVDNGYRGKDIGTKLMNILEEDIIRLGGKEAWLVGKAPGFYLKLGWEAVPREKSPDISKCLTCSKFGNECFPEIMRKTFI